MFSIKDQVHRDRIQIKKEITRFKKHEYINFIKIYKLIFKNKPARLCKLVLKNNYNL